MSSLVLVAEPEEIKLIPLAYKNTPVMVTGVGQSMVDALDVLDTEFVDTIINVGYCGATEDIKIGEVITQDDGEYVGLSIITVDKFAESINDLPENVRDNTGMIVDMEYWRIREWCDDNNVKLKTIKVVSDHLNYKEYKGKAEGKK